MVLKKLFLSIFVTSVFCGGVLYAENPHSCNCPDGEYCADNSNNTCLPCPVGYYCTDNTQYACSGNQIAPDEGMSSYDTCPSGFPAGYIYANESHTACTPCDTGAYVHIDDVCVQCTGATPYANEEHTQCMSLCNFGAYVINSGVCTHCQEGFYPNEGHTQCVACDSGAYIINENNVCVHCPDETPYSNEEHTQCTTCSDGEVVDNVCMPQTGCGIGKYINDNDECLVCPSGYYCPGNGTKSECPKGSYSGEGARLCVKCQTGYTTVASATSAPVNETDDPPCVFAVVKLGTGPNAIELPRCLTYGKINTKVVKNY